MARCLLRVAQGDTNDQNQLGVWNTIFIVFKVLMSSVKYAEKFRWWRSISISCTEIGCNFRSIYISVAGGRLSNQIDCEIDRMRW